MGFTMLEKFNPVRKQFHWWVVGAKCDFKVMCFKCEMYCFEIQHSATWCRVGDDKEAQAWSCTSNGVCMIRDWPALLNNHHPDHHVHHGPHGVHGHHVHHGHHGHYGVRMIRDEPARCFYSPSWSSPYLSSWLLDSIILNKTMRDSIEEVVKSCVALKSLRRVLF